MVLGMLIFGAILIFFLLSIFDRELRDKALRKGRDTFDNILKRSPLAIDKIITDPLTQQIEKFRAGREIGGARVENQTGI